MLAILIFLRSLFCKLEISCSLLSDLRDSDKIRRDSRRNKVNNMIAECRNTGRDVNRGNDGGNGASEENNDARNDNESMVDNEIIRFALVLRRRHRGSY